MDIGVSYFTFAQHISNIVQLGRGCFAFGGDVKDAYRQLGVRAEDLYQQVSAVWDDEGTRYFFLELCGKFGSVSAGDNFARFMAILEIIAASQPAPVDFDNYVDNLISETKKKFVAQARLRRMLAFFRSIGIELHEVFCGRQYSFLGWDIDTVRWLVIMPSKRMIIVLPPRSAYRCGLDFHR
eukprot:g53808.t1